MGECNNIDNGEDKGTKNKKIYEHALLNLCNLYSFYIKHECNSYCS